MEQKRYKRYALSIVLLAGLLLALAVVNVHSGSLRLPVGEVIRTLLLRTGENAAIIWDIRLPRILAVVLLGGALSVSGFLLQTFFANPIASPFILTEKDASYRFVLDQYLASRHLKIEPFLEIGNTEFIIRLLLSGSGFSFLPEFSVRPFLNSGELAVLPVNGFHMRIWRQLLYHKDKWVTREMSAFIRLASDHCVIP